jgi:hypothetical protein
MNISSFRVPNASLPMATSLIAVAVGALALCSPISGSAADLLGLYAGAAIGQADIGANEVAVAFPAPANNVTSLGFKEHATGWKVLAGIRPISLIGAELEYVVLGHPSAQVPTGAVNLGIQADTHPTATTLSGLLYAPIPLPLLDLYGKVGLSRLRTDVHADVVCTATPVNPGCPPTIPFPHFVQNETTNEFAYGAGAQLKFSAFALRLEYERISASGGDPDLLSIGVTWKF